MPDVERELPRLRPHGWLNDGGLSYGLISWEWFRYDAPKLDWSASIEVIPGLMESGRVRGEVDVTLSWQIVGDFFWRLDFYDSYDNRPQPETASKNDYGVTTSLSFDFQSICIGFVHSSRENDTMATRITGHKPVLHDLCCVLLATLPMVVPAIADAKSAGTEKASLSLSIFLTHRDSTTRLDGSVSEPGTDVDLENDLGLKRSDAVFRVDAFYKFNEAHRIDVSWFDLSRTASKQIERDIEWNGTLYPLDTTVDSRFELDIYKVAYTWSFLRSERNFLGATGGLYIADTGTALSAGSIGAREVTSATAPLPVIGLRGQYFFTQKWSFRASGELFFFEQDDWDGDLLDVYVGVDYEFSDRFAVGLGFNSVTFDLGVSKENFTGQLDWGYSGGLVFLRGRF